MRIVYPIAAERRIVRVDEHGEVLDDAAVAEAGDGGRDVFDRLVAFPSLLLHPNLTIEVLLLREDHVRRPQPTTTRRRTRDPGQRRLVDVIDRITPPHASGHPGGAARPAARAVHDARARRRPGLQHASWPSARSTACARSGSSSRPASAAAHHCTRSRRDAGG